MLSLFLGIFIGWVHRCIAPGIFDGIERSIEIVKDHTITRRAGRNGWLFRVNTTAYLL